MFNGGSRKEVDAAKVERQRHIEHRMATAMLWRAETDVQKVHLVCATFSHIVCPAVRGLCSDGNHATKHYHSDYTGTHFNYADTA